MAAPYTFDTIISKKTQTANMAFEDTYISLPFTPMMITQVAITCNATNPTDGLLYYLGAINNDTGANPHFFCSNTVIGSGIIDTDINVPVTEQFPVWVREPYLIFRTSSIAGTEISIQISTRNFDNDYLNITGLGSVFLHVPSGSGIGTYNIQNSNGQIMNVKSIYMVGENVGTPIITVVNNADLFQPIPVGKTESPTILTNNVLTSPFSIGSGSRTDYVAADFDAPLTGDLYAYLTFSIVS